MKKGTPMNSHEINCAHACKNTCSMLVKAMDLEQELTRFYEELDAECDYPDVQTFLHDSIIHHRRMVGNIRAKLEQMEARGRVLDGIMSSFDPAGV